MQPAPAAPTLSKTDISTNDVPYDMTGKEFSFLATLKEITFYLLPIASFLVFLGIVVFAVTPNIQHTITTLSETDDLIAQDQALTTKEQTLKALQQNSEKLQAIIDKINKIVPTGKTSVVDFANRIKDTVSANGISLESLDTGEAVLATTETAAATDTGTAAPASTTAELNLSQIPTDFTMNGKFLNFRSFFKSLYSGTDFFVVEKMNLNLTTGKENWSGTVSLVKYQFTTASGFDPILVYGQINENTQPNNQVVDFVQNKFIDGQL